MRVFGGTPCLVVERFDRRWSKDGMRLDRLVQEDLCQALGVPSTRKYESHGGPGILALMRFLDGSDRREEDRASFMRAQLIYFLLGAIDGHAKNFSIHLTRTGFRLTPHYDILSVWPAVHRNEIAW
jgi:serine/threonine-protein kinase HipA